jgi:hypothetical protein
MINIKSIKIIDYYIIFCNGYISEEGATVKKPAEKQAVDVTQKRWKYTKFSFLCCLGLAVGWFGANGLLALLETSCENHTVLLLVQAISYFVGAAINLTGLVLAAWGLIRGYRSRIKLALSLVLNGVLFAIGISMCV